MPQNKTARSGEIRSGTIRLTAAASSSRVGRWRSQPEALPLTCHDPLPTPHGTWRSALGTADEPSHSPCPRPLAAIRAEPVGVTRRAYAADVDVPRGNARRKELIDVRLPEIQVKGAGTRAEPAIKERWRPAQRFERPSQFRPDTIAARPDAGAQRRDQPRRALAVAVEFGSRHARGVRSGAAPPRMRRGSPMRRRIGKKERHAVGNLHGECDRVVIRADDVSLMRRSADVSCRRAMDGDAVDLTQTHHGLRRDADTPGNTRPACPLDVRRTAQLKLPCRPTVLEILQRVSNELKPP
jgi:hypothetical protein